MSDPTAARDPSQAATAAIEVAGVRKAFGQVTALAGVDLTVTAATLTALLGPNGAGKTTLVRIIATLTRPDAGRGRGFGYEVRPQPGQVRARIGPTGQYAGLDDALSGHDNLMLIGRLAGLSRGQAARRAGGRTAAVAGPDNLMLTGRLAGRSGGRAASRAAELTAALGLGDATGRM